MTLPWLSSSSNTHPPLALAPMAGITDRVFRDICRAQGADYAVSEMVASQAQLRDSLKSRSRHADASETGPRIVQLLGTNPQELADAARWQQDRGAQVIDLNLGCPAKKVCDVAAGSALLAEPEKVARIFAAVRAAVDLPVTAKIRTGVDSAQKNAQEIVTVAEEHGLTAITLHGRTRADKFAGCAEYNTLKTLKETAQIPIIANGDICTPKQAEYVLKYTSCDGIMIGRAAQGYPWIFREISHFLSTGKTLARPSFDEFQSVMKTHLEGLYALYGDQGIRLARKHVGWYSRHLPNGEQLRQTFNRLETRETQRKTVDDFFRWL